MKKAFFLVFLGVSLGLQAQVFQINDTIVYLNNPVDASPAHWYTEIYNLVSVDTTLRWKAEIRPSFPQEWQITFDDQTQFYNPVNHNDSADFTLHDSLSFPQKLIIGNILNERTGRDTVRIHVYEPGKWSEKQTIYWVFNISGKVGLDNQNPPQKPMVRAGYLIIPEKGDLILYTLSGEKVLESQKGQTSVDHLVSGIYVYTYTKAGGNQVSGKLYLP